MIEIVYKEENPDVEQSIKLPKNVKQIGGEPGKRRVYLEDYVVSCIKGNSSTEENGYGVLLGEIKRSGQETYVFVNGAVEAKAPADSPEDYVFDDNVWTGIYEKIKHFFSDWEIVGWYVRTGGDIYGHASVHEKMLKLEKVHLDNFAGSDRICFYYDSVEGEEAIYAYDAGMLRRYYGYYIYYEKNVEMREYLESMFSDTAGNRIGAKEGSTGGDDIFGRNSGRMKTRFGEIKVRQEGRAGEKSSGSSYGKFAPGKIMAGVAVAAVAFSLLNNMGQVQKAKSSMQQLAGRFVEEKQTGDARDSAVDVREVAGNVYPTTEGQSEAAGQQSTEVAADVTATEAAEVQPTTGNEENMPDTQPVTEQATATIEADTNYYIVAEGESLSTICKKIYGSQSKKKEVMELNNITDEDKIYVGQKIKLP